MRHREPGMETMLKLRTKPHTYLRPSSCRLGFGRGFLRGYSVHLAVDETALGGIELETPLTCVTEPAGCKWSTVEPLLKDSPEIRTPLH